MKKKNLILYATKTPNKNTVKIANQIAQSFERHGWKNDIKEIKQDYDMENPDFNFDDYDFVCIGSSVYGAKPLPQISELVYGKPADRKINPGQKCGLVFCTYGGIHLGPIEAKPAVARLESDLMHREFNVVGTIAIPGKMSDKPTPNWYHPDLHLRPNENDLKRVDLFVDEVMEKIRGLPYYA